MSEITPEELASISTRDQLVAAIRRGVPVTVLMSTPMWRELSEARQAVVEQAMPIFKKMLAHLPYYAARMDDQAFWEGYVLSRFTLAKEMVEE